MVRVSMISAWATIGAAMNPAKSAALIVLVSIVFNMYYSNLRKGLQNINPCFAAVCILIKNLQIVTHCNMEKHKANVTHR
jgi:hypothetical protein